MFQCQMNVMIRKNDRALEPPHSNIANVHPPRIRGSAVDFAHHTTEWNVISRLQDLFIYINNINCRASHACFFICHGSMVCSEERPRLGGG
jgi:hypothetical protein